MNQPAKRLLQYLPKKAWQRYMLALSICISVGLAVVWGIHKPHKREMTPITGKASIVEHVKEDSSTWTKHERGVETLLEDVRNGHIAALAFSRTGIYVTTRTGEQYFVTDLGLRVVDALLTEVSKNKDIQSFPIEGIDEQGNARILEWIEAILFLLVGFGLLATCAFSAYVAFPAVFRQFKCIQKQTGIGFGDVIGAHEAKSALSDVVVYLSDIDRYTQFGVKPPKGVLLFGAPGVGKTLLAKALAGQCGVNFLPTTGGAFSSMFYGTGIQRVKALFEEARKNAPCIVFIDEIDGIGKRMEQERASDAELNRIINQVLAEMDGFQGTEGIVVVGATNFSESLDEALTREGRFDRKVYVPLPNIDDRAALFEYYVTKVKIDKPLDCMQLARMSTGMTPAAIASAVNQAGCLAVRKQAPGLSMEHLIEALEVSRIGELLPQSSMMDSEQRLRVAVHEAGHAVVASVLKVGCLEKVSILPRGEAMGVTLVTALNDRQIVKRSELENQIQMLLAGQSAETLLLGEASSGVSNDLKQASKLAFHMVASFGMSDLVFSLEAMRELKMSPQQDQYLAEANALLRRLADRCALLLNQYRGALETVTQLLVEKETIDGKHVHQAVGDLELQGPKFESCATAACDALRS